MCCLDFLESQNTANLKKIGRKEIFNRFSFIVPNSVVYAVAFGSHPTNVTILAIVDDLA